MQLPDGTTLQGGKYTIKRFISAGGFGCTYEGTHEALKIRVAIKEFFVRDYCDRDDISHRITLASKSKQPLVEKLRNKFIEEARALAMMSHPGIVHVYDVFEENGTAYYVMDFIDGYSASDLVEQVGPLDEQAALRIINEAAEALEYVHRKNRLHLDIKPGNIMVASDGTVRLIDFGVSKQYDEAGGSNTSTLLGMTPGYAAPEQMSNNVSLFMPATDVYSLGATLYHLLSGAVPPGATELAVGVKMPPLPDPVSQTTRNAIRSAMEINIARRTKTVDEFIRMLQGANVGHQTGGNDMKQQSKNHPNTTTFETAHKNTPPIVNEGAGAKKSGVGMIPIVVGVFIIAAIAAFAVIKLTGGKETPAMVVDSLATETAAAPVNTAAAKVQAMKYTDDNRDEFVYSGEINDKGVPNGKGTGKYNFGEYTGDYVDGMPTGTGKFKTSDGKNIFEGEFDKFAYVKGKLTYLPEGAYFTGEFKDDSPYTGTLYDKNGKKMSEFNQGKEKETN